MRMRDDMADADLFDLNGKPLLCDMRGIAYRIKKEKRDTGSIFKLLNVPLLFLCLYVYFSKKLIEHPMRRMPDRPYFPPKVTLYNVRH